MSEPVLDDPGRSGTLEADEGAGRFARSIGRRLSRLSARSGRQFLFILAVLMVLDSAAMVTLHLFGPELPVVAEAVGDSVVVVTLTGILVWFVVIRPFQERLHEAVRRIGRHEEAIEAERSRLEFGARLRRAFEMADSEDRAIGVVRRAMEAIGGGQPMELMLADASRAHFRRATAVPGGHEGFGCHVSSPVECPAARQGQAKEFPDSEAIDACPWLLDRRGSEAPRAALCVPVSISGQTVGVLHTVAPRSTPPSESAATLMGTLASRAGDRLGYLRALADSQLAAATDPLTGLPNRRRMEQVVRQFRADGRPFVVALGDIDHFKRLNDTHGHDTGDRALRVFAETMREHLRDDDVVGRLGGEEFVVVLPDVDARQAAVVLERLREALPAELDRGGVPRFTVSFGVADCPFEDDYADLVRAADAALYVAKNEGRDRVVTGSQVPASGTRSPRAGSSADRAPRPIAASPAVSAEIAPQRPLPT